MLILSSRSDRLAFALSTYLPGNGRSFMVFDDGDDDDDGYGYDTDDDDLK